MSFLAAIPVFTFIARAGRLRERVQDYILRKRHYVSLIQERPITDRTLGQQGFGKFASSSAIESGLSILFQYPSGARYKVPLTFVLKWCGGSPEPDLFVVREERRHLLQPQRLEGPADLVIEIASEGTPGSSYGRSSPDTSRRRFPRSGSSTDLSVPSW